MKKIQRKRQSTLRAKKTSALRLPLVTFTPDEVDVLLSMIDLLALVGNDPRAGAALPLVRQIEQRARETQHKLVSIKDRLGKMVAFDQNDYVVLYTAVQLFDQVKRVMPVLLPPPLSTPDLAQRVQAVEAKIVNSLPPRQKRR